MSQREASVGDSTDVASVSTKTASGKTGGSRSTSCTTEQALRDIPTFQPIDAEAASARAAVEQWRTFTMLLEPQVWRLSSNKIPQTTDYVNEYLFTGVCYDASRECNSTEAAVA